MIPSSVIDSRLRTIADRARHQSSVSDLREPTFRMAVRMADLEPHVQFNALMLAAVVSAQALGLNPHEEIERAVRKVASAEGPFTTHVQALRDYVRGELTNS